MVDSIFFDVLADIADFCDTQSRRNGCTGCPFEAGKGPEGCVLGRGPAYFPPRDSEVWQEGLKAVRENKERIALLSKKCYKRAWLEKRAGETIDAPKVAQENPMNTEHCGECFKPISAHRKSKCGLCIECCREKSNAAKVARTKSDVTLGPERNTAILEPLKELPAQYRRREKELAEDVEEVETRLGVLVDRQRIAKKYTDDLEKVIKEMKP